MPPGLPWRGKTETGITLYPVLSIAHNCVFIFKTNINIFPQWQKFVENIERKIRTDGEYTDNRKKKGNDTVSMAQCVSETYGSNSYNYRQLAVRELVI